MSILSTSVMMLALAQAPGGTPQGEAGQGTPRRTPTAQVPSGQRQAAQPQAPQQQATPQGAPQADAAAPGQVTPIVTAGSAVEAPDQPQGRSVSRYRRTARLEPISRVGKDFSSRVGASLRSLFHIRGMEENQVIGFGLVTGLAGTGDSGQLATQLMANTLLAQNINIDPQLLSTSNIAVVRVEAMIPPGAKAGQKIDVRVSAIGDAASLFGGILGITELTDVTGSKVFATASGPVLTHGFTANGNAGQIVKNHNTVGTMTRGGIVQRDIATSVVSDHGFIYLDAKHGQASMGNCIRAVEAINALYPGMAVVMPDGRTVRMEVLDGVHEFEVVAYLDRALNLEIETDNKARVVVNERTGVIVMGGDVKLRPGVVRHGTMVVTVAETPEASQPGPFSNGQTVELPRTALNVTEGDGPLVLLGGASSLEEVVEVLNVLGATPRDMIAILDAMLEGGLLIADLRRL